MKYVTVEIDAGFMNFLKNLKTILKEKKYGVLWEYLKKYYPKEYEKLKRERELGEAKINKKHKGSQKIWLEILNKMQSCQFPTLHLFFFHFYVIFFSFILN